jgi:hypothetical protein
MVMDSEMNLPEKGSKNTGATTKDHSQKRQERHSKKVIVRFRSFNLISP